jgi:2-phospho-L-lactate guanylyltransferase
MAQLVIAVRGGPAAKSRCAEALNADDRAELTAAMLEDMLAAAANTAGVAQVWVVTPTQVLADLAAARAARAILQPEPADLNGAFDLALTEVADQAPYDVIALLPGDLPSLRPSELEAAFALARSHAVVLARTQDGGTGAVLLHAGARLPLAFGEQSFERHRTAAEALGLSLATLEAQSLSRDLDSPDDFALVMDQAPASRTAAFLRRRLQPKIRS